MTERRLSFPTIYEIYPRSFRDTTGTGEGDLNGIIGELGRLADLGIDAIWLAPIYPSAMADGGYDICDHRAVDPRYGDLQTFDRLVAEADRVGIGIVLDMVLNHTSDAHPWFEAALAGDDDMAERYLFRDALPDGRPPNNWMSVFGGSAWRWAPQRSQYYLHQYLWRQPALNMRCTSVKEEHAETLAFWRERGISGFRFDTVTAYLSDPDFRDNPPAGPDVAEKIDGPSNSPYAMQDHIHDILPGDCAPFMEEVRDWAGPDLWLMGECTSGNHALQLVKDFTGPKRLDALYISPDVAGGKRPETYVEASRTIGCVDRMPWWLSCHDKPRSASAMGDGSAESARLFLALLAMLPGPILIYQGEELGLPQPQLTREQTQDPFDMRFWPDPPGRDGARVPIPWSGDRNFGFTTGDPWLPMGWDEGLDYAAQEADPASTLSFARRLFALRKQAGLDGIQQVDMTAEGAVLRVLAQSGETALDAVFNLSENSAGVARLPASPTESQNEKPDGLGPWGFSIALDL